MSQPQIQPQSRPAAHSHAAPSAAWSQTDRLFSGGVVARLGVAVALIVLVLSAALLGRG